MHFLHLKTISRQNGGIACPLVSLGKLPASAIIPSELIASSTVAISARDGHVSINKSLSVLKRR